MINISTSDIAVVNKVTLVARTNMFTVSMQDPILGEPTLPEFGLLVQDVFSTAMSGNSFPDISGEGNDITVGGIQIATFDGTAYLQAEAGALDGLSIVTYIGSAVPTINGDAINYTSGTAEYLQFSDGKEIWFKESDGDEVWTTQGDIPFVVIQDVFSTAPINQVFSDQSVNGNDVTYKNVQVGNFDGAYVDSGVKQEGRTPIDINTIINIPNLTGNYGIISCGGESSASRGCMVRSLNGVLQIYISNGTAITNTDIVTLPTIGLYEISLSWSGLAADDITITVNGTEYTINLNYDWVGLSVYNWLIGTYVPITGYFIGYINYTKVNGKFEYPFQSGDDEIEIDNSGNSNHGTWTGAILADAKGTRIDGIDSVLIKNGYTLFQQIADPTKYITAPYTDLGVPTLTSYAGYNKIAEIPKNVVSNNKILYDGVQVAGIETNATFADINSLEDSPTIEITKDVNTVSNLIVKE